MDRKKTLSILCIASLCLSFLVSLSCGEDVIIIDPDPGGEVVIDPPPPPPPQELTATINIDPNTLNLRSNRQFITTYIELPTGYDVATIDRSTVKIVSLNGQAITPVTALASPAGIGDEDADLAPDLMVKFGYDQVRPLLSSGAIAFGLGGSLTDGKTFAGTDTITVINQDEPSSGNGDGHGDDNCGNHGNDCGGANGHGHNQGGGQGNDRGHHGHDDHANGRGHDNDNENGRHEHGNGNDNGHGGWDDRGHGHGYGHGSGNGCGNDDHAGGRNDYGYSDGNGSGNNHGNGHGNGRCAAAPTVSRTTSQKQYSFSLNEKLPGQARINEVFLWLKTPGGGSDRKEGWHYKSHRQWEEVSGRLGQLRYADVRKGDGYEWDLTDKVSADWTQGVTEVVVRLTDETNRRPVLVVAYDAPSAGTLEETARTNQNLQPVGQKVVVAQESSVDDSLMFNYSDSQLRGVNEKDLCAYYWDTANNSWDAAPDAVIDYSANTVTVPAPRKTAYQLMGKPAPMQAAAPAASSLGQNYPNPFNPATTIGYSVAQDCHVTIRLYNAAGERVATVVDEYQTAGKHSVYYDGGDRLPRGIYYYQMIAGDFVDTKRMVVLH